jgi:hypothetical protein
MAKPAPSKTKKTNVPNNNPMAKNLLITKKLDWKGSYASDMI